MTHETRLERDEYGRLRAAVCFCRECEAWRTWTAILLLGAAAAGSIWLVAWACR